MRRIECARHLIEDRQRSGRRERAVLLDPVTEVSPLHQLHRHEQASVDLAGVVDRKDVRVAQTGGDAPLVHEALPAHAVLGELAGEDLERDGAVHRNVRCAVDRAHAAACEWLVDPVAADHVAGREARHVA